MRAVLFDVDGVLIDSYGGYRQVWNRWCVMRSVPFEAAWSATHRRRPVETIAEVAPHLDPVREYAVLRQLMHDIGDQFPAFPAAAPAACFIAAGALGGGHERTAGNSTVAVQDGRDS